MTGTSAQTRSVTRVEVIDAIVAIFTDAPVSKAGIIAAAAASGVRQSVVELLEQLPERVYRRPADLWHELPGVPIEP